MTTTNASRFTRYGDTEQLRQLAAPVRTAAVFKAKTTQTIRPDTLSRWEPLRPLLSELTAQHRELWKIAQCLNELKVRTAAGKSTWYSMTVSRALRVLNLR